MYLQTNRIAHRDVRSDNLLINSSGEVKLSGWPLFSLKRSLVLTFLPLLADFSTAVHVKDSPWCNDAVGVLYWQAPEVRRYGL